MQLNKGYFMVMGAGICWATTGIFSVLLFREGVEPLEVASIRVALAALFFFLYFLPRLRGNFLLKKRELLFFAVSGFVGVGLFNYFYLQAIDRIGVSIAVVLLYTSPVFVIVISFFLLKENITLFKIMALLIALTGVFLVVRGPELFFFPVEMDLGGIAMGLGAGLAFGLLSILGKYALGRHEMLQVVFYLMFFGALSFMLFSPPWIIFQGGFSISVLLLLLAIALISTFLAHLLYIFGLKFVEAGRASIAVAVEPPTAIFLAFLFLGENLVFWQYIGVALVLMAVVLLHNKS